MKRSSLFTNVLFVLSLVAVGALAWAGPAMATDGTWNTPAPDVWSAETGGVWVDDIIADGSGATAYFNTLDLAGDATVHLDSPRTIGALKFGDIDIISAGGWILDNNGDPLNILTLESLGGTAPRITVKALGTGSVATISAVIDGTSGLTKEGDGTLTLGGANIYTGLTTVSQGTLQYGIANAIPAGNDVTVDGATAILDIADFNGSVGAVILANGGSITGAAGVLTSSATFDVRSGSISAILSGANGLTKSTADTVTLSNANNYTGTTTISAGTLNANAINALPTAGGRTAVSMTGTSTLSLGAAQSIASLTGVATSTVNLNGNALTIGGTTNTTYGGVISSTAGTSLIKDGASILNLSIADASFDLDRIAVTISNGKIDRATTINTPGDFNNNNGQTWYVGKSTAGNSLTINAGGTLTGVRNAVIGDGALSTGNTATIDGTGARWELHTADNSTGDASVYLGNNGGSNTLTVQNGGRLFARQLQIGMVAGADGNKAYIKGPSNLGSPSLSLGAILQAGSTGNNSYVYVGVNSSSNSLEITDGAYVRVTGGSGTTNSYIGRNSGSNSNSMIVRGVNATTGDKSTFSTGGQRLIVGGAGNNNTLTVDQGGQVVSRVFQLGESGGSNNVATVDGSGSSLTSSEDVLIASGTGASNNTMTVSGGGYLSSTTRGGRTERSLSVGEGSGANNNSLTVTGSSSSWVSNGYQVLISAAGVGGTAPTSTGYNNSINIYGGATATINTGVTVGGTDTTTNSAFNLGNGTGISTATIGSTRDGAVNLFAAPARMNFNNGRLIAGVAGALVSGLGRVDIKGPAYFSTTYAGSSIDSIIEDSTSSAGTVTKEGVGTLSLTNANTYGGGTIVSGGKLLINNTTDSGTGAGSVAVKTGGTLGGTGSIGGAVTVEDGGTLAPGAGVGILNVGTSVTMAVNSTYNWEFGGATTADKVVITGSLTLDSGLKVKLMNTGGGTPLLGSTYDLFTYGSFSGSFEGSSLDVTSVPTWPPAQIAQDTGRIYVRFSKPGDANNDGVVDAADYITVKRNFGMTSGAKWSDGNFTSGGTVDWYDLQILMANFSTRSIVEAPAAPEPATLGLLAIGALALLRRRKA